MGCQLASEQSRMGLLGKLSLARANPQPAIGNDPGSCPVDEKSDTFSNLGGNKAKRPRWTDLRKLGLRESHLREALLR